MELPGEQQRNIALKISEYFRAFLETDFKKVSAPRRRIVTVTDAGFRASMRTSPYPGLDKEFWAQLSKPTQQDLSFNLTPRKFTRPISDVLMKVIKEQIQAIPEAALVTVRRTVRDEAATTYGAAAKNPEEWIEGVQTTLADSVADQVVRPLIAHLDGPLKQQAYWVMDTLLGAESDLIQRVTGDLSRVLPEPLAKLLATGEEQPLVDAVENFLTLEATHANLLAFFVSFAAADAYLEFRDLETYVATAEGMQLYLYVGALHYRGNAYPLFFLPIDVEKLPNGGYKLSLANHLYAHRRALDYVLEELAQTHNRQWMTPVTERITYVEPERSIFEVARMLFAKVAMAMDLGGQIELSSTAADVSNTNVRLSSSLVIAAAERSDEALINDFEEIIQLARAGGNTIVRLFEGIVGDVLTSNPKSIQGAINAQWDALPLVDRMVCDSPIPLNEDQRKVQLAVDHPDGKVIKVSGPPGTGKSHTISAIAASCAYKKKSCLILSDKPEALNVAYDKLSEAMSSVRHDRNFPNAILRLGRTDANFKKLTSASTVAQITNYVRSMKANEGRIEADREESTKTLKSQIAQTVATLGSISLADVRDMHHNEEELRALAPATVAVLERCTDASVLPELRAIEQELTVIEPYLRSVFAEGDFTPASLLARAKRDAVVTDFLANDSTAGWEMFDSLDAQQIRMISALLAQYDQLKMPILGYLLRGSAVAEINLQLNELPTNQPVNIKQHQSTLHAIVAGTNALRQKLESADTSHSLADCYKDLARGATAQPAARAVVRLIALLRRIDPEIEVALLAQEKDEAKLWPLAVRFLASWLATRQAFVDAPVYDYVGSKTRLERLSTSKMNSHVDGRLVDFMDNNKSDARSLAGVISNRQKFPEDKFELIRDSFPIAICSIREFGEFMPLLPDLFDVVIIDEASQVSVAQALPALLRAKKVVVMGDDKQFSNVKSANASIEVNEKYRSELVNYFRTNVSNAADVLQRLAIFDVKKSVLDFASLTASADIMLRKHFRSYPELIGYSSRMFYGGQLQAIKIRSKPLDEVIRFSQVEIGESKCTRGINEAEAYFILDRLLELLEEEDPPTVGVITPFREQQSYLSKLFFSHQKGSDFEDKLRLKVMTFDSCQGEERHICFYSMVATPGADALNYVFPVSIDDAEQAVEEKLKVQRLNVGFSRAQECIWVVHSKPLDQYKGSIGQALNHYKNVLDKAHDLPDASETESPMEAMVLDWIHRTQFYQSNIDNIEVFAQFAVGSYLKALDPTYEHPDWRADFLIAYHSPKTTVSILCEYDGFQFHFQKDRNVHVGNHERYLVEGDVERQLTLESYGYKFIRINRFNTGVDPVETLSRRLYALVEMALGEPVSQSVAQVQAVAEGLSDNSLKTCSRCQQIKPKGRFFDKSLKGGYGGYGRVCMDCKDLTVGALPRPPSAPRQKSKFRSRWR